jgi:hypothetical protein
MYTYEGTLQKTQTRPSAQVHPNAANTHAAIMKKFSLDNTLLDRFMLIGTCGPCVEIGGHIASCVAFDPSGRVREGEVKRGTLCTWNPKHKVHLLLVQLDECCTVVYVVEKHSFYYATEVTALPSNTPTGSILVACYTEDVMPTHKEPRVLIHDVVTWGVGNAVVESLRTLHVTDRYRILREEFAPLLVQKRTTTQGVQAACPVQYCVLQWCGFLDAAKGFVNGSIEVGHEVDGLLMLRENDALRPCMVSQ